VAGVRPWAALLLAAGLAACGDAGSPVAPRPSPPAWVERTLAPRKALGPAGPALLVLLHGIGAAENDLFSLAGEFDQRFRIVSLRAPYDYHSGHAWFRIDFGADGSITPDAAQANATLADLVHWLDAAPTRFGTDPTRTYLLGFSQGAMMCVGVLRTAPERVAGVVALSGRADEAVFRQRADRDATARVPVFMAHGLSDDVIRIADARRGRDAFQSLSHDFTWREYPIRHGIDSDEVHDVVTWLTAHLDRPVN